MFGRSRQEALNTAEIARLRGEHDAHVDGCEKRYEQISEDLKELDKTVRGSARDAQDGLVALNDQVNKRHSANQRWLIGILLAVLASIGVKFLDGFSIVVAGVPH